MTAPAQMGFFDRSPAPPQAVPRRTDGRTPYPHQEKAVAGILAKLASDRSTLVTLPTGTGKTFTAWTYVDRHEQGTVLWLAHREELIDQAIADAYEVTGELPAKEKADERAMGGRLVVASVQTLKGVRLEDFRRRFPDVALIIVDEAHHAVAPSYRAILGAYQDAAVLGLTATPDRADERAMGQVFDSVAFAYDVLDAINDGYLCPVVRRRVLVDAIDLSAVGTVAGDFNQGELDTAMSLEKVLHGIAEPLMREAGDRRTILFSTSVDNAHRMAEILNRYRPECARAVDGGAELKRSGERGRILDDHKSGAFQFLCNVGVLTEGYDDKAVSCVAIARPTKSRSLYAQMAGRGLRILAGKKDCLLLDFVGRNGGHKLATAMDILGGKLDDEVIAKAKEIADRDDTRPAHEAVQMAMKAIADAKKREAEKRARIKAKVAYRTESVDPFDLLHLKHDPEADAEAQRFGMTATEKQIATLTNAGVTVPENLSRRAASDLIGSIFKRRDLHLASFRQLKTLARYGVTDVNIGFKRASEMIDAIANNGWRLPANLTDRQPGEEG